MTNTKPQEAHRTSSRVNAQTDRQTKKHAVDITLKLQKSKTKKKILERSSGGTLFIEKQRQKLLNFSSENKKEEDRAEYFKVLRECYPPV